MPKSFSDLTDMLIERGWRNLRKFCDVCHKNEAAGVYASSCGPISFGYCKECALKGVEPYGALVAYLSTAVNTSLDLEPERGLIRP